MMIEKTFKKFQIDLQPQNIEIKTEFYKLIIIIFLLPFRGPLEAYFIYM